MSKIVDKILLEAKEPSIKLINDVSLLGKYLDKGWYIHFGNRDTFSKKTSSRAVLQHLPNGFYAFPLTTSYLKEILKDDVLRNWAYGGAYIHLFQIENNSNILHNRNYSEEDFKKDEEKISKISKLPVNKFRFKQKFEKLVNLIWVLFMGSQNKMRKVYLYLGYQAIYDEDYSLCSDIPKQIIILDLSIMKNIKTTKNPFFPKLNE